MVLTKPELNNRFIIPFTALSDMWDIDLTVDNEVSVKQTVGIDDIRLDEMKTVVMAMAERGIDARKSQLYERLMMKKITMSKVSTRTGFERR